MQSITAALRRDPVLWAITLFVALVHLACAGRYGFFRDELYFIICGRHPDYGYADQPALIPLLSAATQVFGENLFLLRLPAVLAAVAIVPVTGALARLLGGNRTAVTLAGAAAALSPLLEGLDVQLITSSFDALTWTGIAYFLMRAFLRDDRTAPLWAGLVAGIAFEVKFTVTFWLLALAVAVIATPARRLLAFRSLWLGLALAALLAAPSLIWQTLNDWPFLVLMHGHYGFHPHPGQPLLDFAINQTIIVNPFLAPFWLAGLFVPFFIRALMPARMLAIAFLITAAIILGTHGKDYYLAGAYPTLFAIGAVALAGWAWWLRAVVMTAAVVESAIVAPLVLPFLDPAVLERYIEVLQPQHRPVRVSLPGVPPAHPEFGRVRFMSVPVAQIIFSDQFGWPELEQKVAAVYKSLPPEERAKAAVLVDNWGEAAALDFYGPADGLPPALSGHNQYFLWGPGDWDGKIVILVNKDLQRLKFDCGSLQVAALFGAPYAMESETDRPIAICRDMDPDLHGIWPKLKRIG